MKRGFLLLFIVLFVNSCSFGFDTHKVYNTEYIAFAHSIDLTENKKKGKACATTKESAQDLVFEAARLGGLKRKIIFIEKVRERNQFCTVVYGY